MNFPESRPSKPRVGGSIPSRRADTAAERFWAKVDRSQLSPGGCWPWVGAQVYGSGGAFRYEGKSHRASRVALLLTGVAIPDGKFVLHRCDQPLCVNPDHLRVGTAAENSADYLQRGKPAFRLEAPARRRYVCQHCGAAGHNRRTCDALYIQRCREQAVSL